MVPGSAPRFARTLTYGTSTAVPDPVVSRHMRPDTALSPGLRAGGRADPSNPDPPPAADAPAPDAPPSGAPAGPDARREQQERGDGREK
ncbi:hypothetical protein Shyhy01_07250 [Streptomyces hygroscopicus subsp. hygroscopicus]|nr:hypothetical protein Shyhy01_07250 [Streptomyces hygroscopicus subsp. hygroscopicus]